MSDEEQQRRYAQRMQQKKILDGLKNKATVSYKESINKKPESLLRGSDSIEYNMLAKKLIKNSIAKPQGQPHSQPIAGTTARIEIKHSEQTAEFNKGRAVIECKRTINPRTIYSNNFIDIPSRHHSNRSELHLPDWLMFNGTADVSVIIPMFKSQDVLTDLINSIPKNHHYKVEYIFVDDCCPNHCKDLILPLFAQRKNDITKPLVKTIQLHSNVGFGQACNHGAKVATGKNLIFLNADTQLTSGWVEPIIDLLSSDPNIGLVGNMQLIHGTDLIDSAGSEWSIRNQCFLHIGRSSYHRNLIRHPMRYKEAPSDLLEVAEREMVTGCCIGISKSLFDYIGGFNPNYKVGYWEDAELCMTVKELGYKVMFQPNSIIYHRGQHTKSAHHRFTSHNINYFRNKWINSGRMNSLLLNHHEPSARPPQSILIVRKNSNGDVLIASSVCQALKQKYPDCHITFATNYKDCLLGNPFIDEIISHHEYKNKRYHVVYNLDQLNDWRPTASIRNIFAEHVGVKPEDCKCTMKVTKPENIELPKDYIVIHPGESDWVGRNWPKQNWHELSQKLINSHENIIVVGKSDFMPNYKDNCIPCSINLIDKLKSDELAYVIKEAKMFIGIDSFPMHVAQAQDTPGLAFFGSVSPEAIITNPKMRSISAKELPCISCHKHTPVPISPVYRCKIGTRECETRVTVDRMWNEVQRILQEIKNESNRLLG